MDVGSRGEVPARCNVQASRETTATCSRQGDPGFQHCTAAGRFCNGLAFESRAELDATVAYARGLRGPAVGRRWFFYCCCGDTGDGVIGLGSCLLAFPVPLKSGEWRRRGGQEAAT